MCVPCQQVSFLLQLASWISLFCLIANDTLVLPLNCCLEFIRKMSESVQLAEAAFGPSESLAQLSGTPVQAVPPWAKSEPLVISQLGDCLASAAPGFQ